MDLNRASGEEKLLICKRYFFVGLALLPFIWLINCVWFFREAFLKPIFPEQATIKKYLILSFVGLVLWTIVFITWTAIYHTNRLDWGAVGDQIAFHIPVGIL